MARDVKRPWEGMSADRTEEFLTQIHTSVWLRLTNNWEEPTLKMSKALGYKF